MLKTTIQDVRAQYAALAHRFVRYGENDNEITRWFGWGPVQWCAETVSYVFWLACHVNGEKSPLENTQTAKGTAYSGTPMQLAQSGLLGWSWHEEPLVGAAVVYDWGDGGMTDHVGWVDSIQGGPRVAFTAWEGNTGTDDVRLVPRDNRSGYVVGFAMPSYGRHVGPVPPPVPPGTPAWPGRVLSVTSPLTTGADVRAYQARMVERGWTVTPDVGPLPAVVRWMLGTLGYHSGEPFEVDGVFGAQTLAVTCMFQLDKHLIIDGQVGSVTWQSAFRTDNVTP